MWKNVEARMFKFDPETVDQDECFLRLEAVLEAAGGYGPTSTEMDVDASLNARI